MSNTEPCLQLTRPGGGSEAFGDPVVGDAVDDPRAPDHLDPLLRAASGREILRGLNWLGPGATLIVLVKCQPHLGLLRGYI